jgi:hypothetical protein
VRAHFALASSEASRRCDVLFASRFPTGPRSSPLLSPTKQRKGHPSAASRSASAGQSAAELSLHHDGFPLRRGPRAHHRGLPRRFISTSSLGAAGVAIVAPSRSPSAAPFLLATSSSSTSRATWINPVVPVPSWTTTVTSPALSDVEAGASRPSLGACRRRPCMV